MLLLGQLGTDAKAAVPTLTAQLKNPDKNIRAQAVHALAGFAPDEKELLESFIAALEDQDATVRLNAAAAVKKYAAAGKDALRPLLKCLAESSDKALSGEIIDAVFAIGPDSTCVKPLYQVVTNNATKDLHAKVCPILAKVPRGAGLTALKNLLNYTGDKNVRISAAKAIGTMGRVAARNFAVAQALKAHAERDLDEDVKQACKDAIENLTKG
jgi:HEAT repeat protein